MRLRQVSIMTPSLWQAEREIIDQLGVTVVNRDRVQELPRLSRRLTELLEATADETDEETVLHLSKGGTITVAHDPLAERDGMTAVEFVASDRSRVGEECHIAGTAMRFV